MTRHRFLASAWALALVLTAVAYGRVVPGYFLGDDFGGLALFRDLRASELWSLFRIWEGQGHWRPLWGLVFWCVHAVFGLWAPAFHLVALLLHAACGVLLAALVVRLGGGPAAGLWACVLFVVHPAQAPSLGWIASVQEPLVTCCCLLALWAELRYLQDGGTLAAVLALAGTALALSTKEAAVGVLPAAIAAWWCVGQSPVRRRWLPCAMAVLVLGYLVFRIATGSLPSGLFADRTQAVTAAGLLVGDAAGWLLGAGELAGALLVAAAVAAGLLIGRAPGAVRKAMGLLAMTLGFLLPQLPVYAGFTPNNTRLLHTAIAPIAALAALALSRHRAVQLLLLLLALASLWTGRGRLAPFVEAGQLSARYHQELMRVLPPDELPRDGAVLHFFTNEVPLPDGTEPANYRPFWPPFGQVELAVQYGLRLPRPVFLREDPGPATVQEAVLEFGTILQVEIAGMHDRAQYLRFVQERARRIAPDPHIVVLFWDHAARTLERFSRQDVFGH